MIDYLELEDLKRRADKASRDKSLPFEVRKNFVQFCVAVLGLQIELLKHENSKKGASE